MAHALIARQPIVDAEVRVVAYELLYRGQGTGPLAGFDGETATATVAINTLLDLGLSAVAGEHPVYVNLTRAFFERELYLALPSSRVVLEVLEDVEPDAAMAALMRRARALGYRVALDDYVHHERMAPLVAEADIVKVDALTLDERGMREVVAALRRPGLVLLAEKIETRERFEMARDAGFELFQGWFYARPDLLRRRTLQADRATLLQVLAAIEDSEVDFEEIGRLVECNLALSHKLLRYVNSALFTLPQEVDSIRHACTMLGLERLRTCVLLLLLSEVDDKPRELMFNALSRARLCQMLAPHARADVEQKYFTVGLFSLLDAYLDQSLEDLLAEIPLTEDVKRAILEHAGEPGAALDAAVACERADWQALEQGPVAPERLQRLYVSALEWTRQVERVLARSQE
jgi:EAL and modified HD-GYP domain-containing signal transduction protein